MNYSSRNKKGFTVIEVIMSLCFIVLASGGLYLSYNTLIRTTKSGEEKQQIALVGKNTLENIKSCDNSNFEFSDDSITIKNISFFNSKNESKDHTFNISEKSGRYVLELYLNNHYEYCESSDEDCTYKEKIIIMKAKAKSTDKEGTTVDINPGVSTEESDSKKAELNNYESIDFDKIHIKNDGSNRAEIDNKSLNEIEGRYLLNMYVNKSGDKGVIIKIEDNDGSIIKQYEKQIDESKNNNLNVYFNFKDYKKTGDDPLRDFDIEVYNKTSIEDKIICNLYIESADDCKVSVLAKK
ncbi:MAG: type II secretion system protein, partial [Clostridium sp.]